MRKICYFLLFCLALSCSKDEIRTRKIQLAYAETEINTTLRTAGNIAPVIIDWDGKPGTYSITSSSEILQQGSVAFDTLTGQLSWEKDLPVGTYGFTINAKSDDAIAVVEILLTNTFIEGFFSGGFAKVDGSEESLLIGIFIDYGLHFDEDGTISMERYSNPAFLASGDWTITEEGVLSVAFISNLSGGATTYMKGDLSFTEEEKLPRYAGEYGNSLDENGAIENPTGVFSFRWD